MTIREGLIRAEQLIDELEILYYVISDAIPDDKIYYHGWALHFPECIVCNQNTFDRLRLHIDCPLKPMEDWAPSIDSPISTALAFRKAAMKILQETAQEAMDKEITRWKFRHWKA